MLYDLGHLFSPQLHYSIYTSVLYTVAFNRASNKVGRNRYRRTGGYREDLCCGTATECCIPLRCMKTRHCDRFNKKINSQ